MGSDALALCRYGHAAHLIIDGRADNIGTAIATPTTTQRSSSDTIPAAYAPVSFSGPHLPFSRVLPPRTGK